MKVRWVRVLVTVGVLFVIVIASNIGLHQYRVWQAGGNWCMVFDTSGKGTAMYGQDCGFEVEPRAEKQ